MPSNDSTWERFFDGHAPVYMQNCFTTNTVAEVECVIDELGHPPGSAILDIGSGMFDFGVTAKDAEENESSMHMSLQTTAQPDTGWFLVWED